MAVKKTTFDDFDGQEEVAVESKPQIKFFKKKDLFIGYISSINDRKLNTPMVDKYGNDSYGSKIFNLVCISDKCVDHKSDDGSAAGDAIPNEILVWEEYAFFTNYKKYKSWDVWLDINGRKLDTLPLWSVVKLEFVDKQKAEGSQYFYKNISIIWKKDDKWEYVIHPDYKAPEDFSGTEDEISVEDIPF